MAGSATNPEEEEDWDADVTPPPCPLAPGCTDLVSQLNQDPRAESITDFGLGTTAIEEDVESNAVREDVESNAVREESVKDETSCAVLNNSSRPDDLTRNADIPYLEITDDSTTVCKTPVASSTPAATPPVDAMLSPPESPGNKKQCQETMAERLLWNTSTEIMEPDYKDAPLVGYTRSDLSNSLDTFQSQSMMEPPGRLNWQRSNKMMMFGMSLPCLCGFDVGE